MAYRGTQLQSPTQQVQCVGTGTSFTQTIAAVDPNNTILILSGFNRSVAGIAFDLASSWVRVKLTNSTTLTITRGTADGTVHLHVTVVEFRQGVLKGNVQRGEVTVSGTTNTASLTAVNTAKSVLASMGMSQASGGTDRADEMLRWDLTNSTTATASKQANPVGNSVTGGFEAYEFR